MTIVEFSVFAPAYIVFVVVMFAHLALLFGYKPGSKIYNMAYYIICKTSLENLFCVLVTIPSALGIIARVLYGACPPDSGFWDTMICNSEAEANALPQDMVMLTFLSPVVTFLFLKGVRKETIIILWVIASGSTLGCIIYLQSWKQIWAWIIPTVFTPLIAYEFERSKIAFFLQSRKTLQEEKQKRLKAEQERQEQERLRLEQEAFEAQQEARRQAVLSTLPVHSAIVSHAAQRRLRHRSSLAGSSMSLLEAEADGQAEPPGGTEPASQDGPGPSGSSLALPHDRLEDDAEAGEDVAAALAAVERHADTLALRDYDGRSAFDLATTLEGVDRRVIARVLFHHLPVDPATGAAVPPGAHDFAWHRAVQQDRYAPVVARVLDRHPLLAEALAASEDAEGRHAVNIASAQCKRLILQCIYLHQRYEVRTRGQPHHESATCVVHLGVDHGDGARAVALKFMKHRDQFLREIEVRRLGAFSDQFVVGIVRSHDGDADPAFLAELRRKGLDGTPYCVVMDAGSRSLADVIVKEHLAGDWDKIRALCAHITRAVGHMHSKGYIHGDLKREPRAPCVRPAWHAHVAQQARGTSHPARHGSCTPALCMRMWHAVDAALAVATARVRPGARPGA
jgi:hypothetical protein